MRGGLAVEIALSEEAHSPSHFQFCSDNSPLRVGPGQTGPPGEKGQREKESPITHTHHLP